MRAAIIGLLMIAGHGSILLSAQDTQLDPGVTARAPSYVVVTADDAEIRVETDVIGRASKGQRLRVIEWSGSWLAVLLDESDSTRSGWISAADVAFDLSGPTDVAPSAPEMLQIDIDRTQFQSQGVYFYVRISNRSVEPIEIKANQFRMFAGTAVPAPITRGYITTMVNQGGYRSRSPQDFSTLRLRSESVVGPGQSIEGWLGFAVGTNYQPVEGPFSLQFLHPKFPLEIDFSASETEALELQPYVDERYPGIPMYLVQGRLNRLNFETLREQLQREDDEKVIILVSPDTSIGESFSRSVRNQDWMVLAAQPNESQDARNAANRSLISVGSLEHAAIALIAQRDGGEAKLLQMLDDADLDPGSASVVVRELAKTASTPDSIRRLEDLAMNGSRVQRMRLAQGLITSGADPWVSGILNTLARDPDPSVRATAIPRLAALKSNQYFPLIAEAVSSPDESLRYTAIAALAHYPNDQTIEILTSLLESAEQQEVATALSVIRGFPRGQISENAIRRLSDQIVRRLDDPNENIARYVRSAFSSDLFKKLPPEMIDVLIHQVRAGAELGSDQIQSLAKADDEASESLLIELLRGGPAQRASRQTAIAALGRRKSIRAVEPLISMLRYSHDDRAEVAAALGQIGDPAAVEALRELARDRTLPTDVRLAVNCALIRLNDDEVLAHLPQSLNDIRNSSRFVDVLLALSESSEPEARNLLKTWLSDYRSASHAISQIMARGNSELVDLLTEAIDPNVVRLSINYVARADLTPERRIQMLTKWLDSDYPDVRTQALSFDLPNTGRTATAELGATDVNESVAKIQSVVDQYDEHLVENPHRSAIINRMVTVLMHRTATAASIEHALEVLERYEIPDVKLDKSSLRAGLIINDLRRVAHGTNTDATEAALARCDAEILATFNSAQLAEFEYLRLMKEDRLEPIEWVTDGEQAIRRVIERHAAEVEGANPQVVTHLSSIVQLLTRKAPAESPERLRELVSELQEQVPELAKLGMQIESYCAQAQLATQIWSNVSIERWDPLPESVVKRIEACSGLVDDHFAFCQRITLGEFLQLAERMRSSGYRPTRVRPQVDSAGDIEVAAIWNRDGRPWVLQSGLSEEELMRADKRHQAEGKLPVDLSAVWTSDTKTYLAIWTDVGMEGEERRIELDVPLTAAVRIASAARSDGFYPICAQISRTVPDAGSVCGLSLIYSKPSHPVPLSLRVGEVEQIGQYLSQNNYSQDFCIGFDEDSKSIKCGLIVGSSFLLESQSIRGLSPEHMLRLSTRMVEAGYRLIAMDIARPDDGLATGAWIWVRRRQ